MSDIENTPSMGDIPQMEKPEIPLGYRRADGSAVGLVDGNPYHFTPESRHWDDVKDRIDDLPLQEVLPDGRMLPEYVDGELVTELPPLPAPSSRDVNAERDRRISAGFTFGGKPYDFDMKAKTNISGAAQMAFMAIVTQPALATSSMWNGGQQPFSWIAADNSAVEMTAQTVIAFGRAAAGHEQSHIMAGRLIKDMTPIPDDFKDDSYWPANE